MNQGTKNGLLILLTLSLLTIAIIEITGISRTALFYKYGIGTEERLGTEKETVRAGDARKLPRTTIEFAETHHSFGEITDGTQVSHIYKVKNTGNAPLLITKVEASCGCTAPSYPDKPVSPGETGEITIAFNSTNRLGSQRKEVTVLSNATQGPVKLTFDAQVKPRN